MQTVSAKACHGLQPLMGLVAVCGFDRLLSHSNRNCSNPNFPSPAQAALGTATASGYDCLLSHRLIHSNNAKQFSAALLNQQLVSKLQPWMQNRAFRWDIADLEVHACHLLKTTLDSGTISGSDCPLSHSSNAKQNHFTLAQASVS